MMPVTLALRIHLHPRHRTKSILSSSIILITSRLSTSVAASSLSAATTTASNDASSSRGQNDNQQLASLHIPVMCNEVLRLWMPERLQQQQSSSTPPTSNSDKKMMYLIDGTLGLGGHTSAMLAHAATAAAAAASHAANHPDHRNNCINVRVLGIDRDKSSLVKARRRIESDTNNTVSSSSSSSSSSMVSYHHGSFANLSNDILRQYSFPPTSGVHGILVDLGMNSGQIHDAERGFTFRKSAPLDMRYDTRGGMITGCIRAEQIVNTWSVDELCCIFTRSNEEYAHDIATAIVHWREEKYRGVRAGQQQRRRRDDNSIRSTLELRYIIEETVASMMMMGDTTTTTTAAAAAAAAATTTTTITKKLKHSVNNEDITQNNYTKYRYIWHRLPNTHELTKIKRDKLLFKYQECKPRYTAHVMRCFQALRIASNNELYHIEQLFTILTPSSSSSTSSSLPETSQQGEENEESSGQCCCLAIGGHFVAIAFHPGEDEVIKLGMKRLVDTGQYKYLTPEEDGLRPTYEEIKSNSRSRTARLRAVERVC